jgi:hypothetical protein
MFVFGMYSSSHPYDTEQLWAGFFKMLLDKRLVPKIFLSNVSPAFEWIKQFVPSGEFQSNHLSRNLMVSSSTLVVVVSFLSLPFLVIDHA